MAKSAPKLALGIGCTLIVLCVIAGLMVSRGTADRSRLEAMQTKFNKFASLKSWSSVEAEAFAKEVLSVNDLQPAALSYDHGILYLLIPLKPSFIDKIFSPGMRSYRSLGVRDFNGAFEKRWRSGLAGRFGAVIKASGRTQAYFNPRFGKIVTSWKVHKAGSSNPLDYLTFDFHP